MEHHGFQFGVREPPSAAERYARSHQVRSTAAIALLHEETGVTQALEGRSCRNPVKPGDLPRARIGQHFAARRMHQQESILWPQDTARFKIA